MHNLISFGYVALGGAAGASLRYFLTLVFLRNPSTLPLATLVSNLAGCFLLGFFLQIGLSATMQHHAARLLLATGFCGGFTTMSTFVLELSDYLKTDQPFNASIYFVMTLAGAMVSFYVGIAAARVIIRQ